MDKDINDFFKNIAENNKNKEINELSSFMTEVAFPLNVAIKEFSIKSNKEDADEIFAAIIMAILLDYSKNIDESITTIDKISNIIKKDLIRLDKEMNK